jgi:hypothetical protein
MNVLNANNIKINIFVCECSLRFHQTKNINIRKQSIKPQSVALTHPKIKNRINRTTIFVTANDIWRALKEGGPKYLKL